MNKRYNKIRNYVLTAGMVLVLVGLFFTNYLYTSHYPGGTNFQTQWIAVRAVIDEKADPYSEGVLYKIQTSAYGRPAMAGEYEFRFTYPYFSLLLFIPFGLIKNYAVARAAWMVFLEIMIFVIFWLSMNLANWKPANRIFILLLIFSMTFYYALRAVVDGNLMILETVIFAAMLISLRDHNDELTGLLLAGLLFEPQYTLPLIILILVYAAIQKRWKIISFFSGTLIVLMGFSFLFLPGWLGEYLRQLWLSISGFSYSTFIGVLRTFMGALGLRFGMIISIALAIGLIIEALLLRNKKFLNFLWFCFFTVVIIQWIGLPSLTGNYIILLPGLVFTLKLLNERWKDQGDLFVVVVCITLFVLGWVVFFVSRKTILAYTEPLAYYFILPIIEFILLYWSKWWVNRQTSFRIGF